MSDLISREAAIEALKRAEALTRAFGYHNVIETIRELPTAERVGKWNWDFADNGWADWTCSICGWKMNTDIHVNLGYNYCPNCGARMEGEEDE